MANMHGLRNAGQLEQSTANRNAKHCAYVRQCPLLVSQSQSVTALITPAEMNSCQHAENNNICNVNQGEDSEDSEEAR